MRRFAAPALIALLALFGAGAAAAFTLEPVSPSAAGDSQKLAAPDELAPMQRLTTQPDGAKGLSFGDSGFSLSITGNGSNGPSSSYLDPTRPWTLTPYGPGASPFLPYRR